MINILTDKQGYIIGYATLGGFVGGIDIDEAILPEGFTDDFWERKYRFINGAIERTDVEKPREEWVEPEPDYDAALIELAGLLDIALTRMDEQDAALIELASIIADGGN